MSPGDPGDPGDPSGFKRELFRGQAFCLFALFGKIDVHSEALPLEPQGSPRDPWSSGKPWKVFKIDKRMLQQLAETPGPGLLGYFQRRTNKFKYLPSQGSPLELPRAPRGDCFVARLFARSHFSGNRRFRPFRSALFGLSRHLFFFFCVENTRHFYIPRN